MGCTVNNDVVGYQNKQVIQGDAFPTATSTLTRTEPLFYNGTDLMLKIQGYVPPMKEELQQQKLCVDTWSRETLLPSFFYDYFTKTFMIPAYTCDKLKENNYPGLDTTYSCYCNNGDYHTMPTINLEVTDHNF